MLNTMNHPIKHITLVGNGITPVLTALFIQKKWGSQSPQITWIVCGENADDPIINSVSTLKKFHADLGLAEKVFFKKANANFHLGSFYFIPQADTGFSKTFISEGPFGAHISGVRFHHWFCRYRQEIPSARYEQFCLNAILSSNNRFSPPSPKPNSVYSQVCYGYKITSNDYANFLKSMLPTNIQVIQSDIVQITSNDSGIQTLYLQNEQTISSDFYIDCTREHIVKHILEDEASIARRNQALEYIAANHHWNISDYKGSLGPTHNQITLKDNRIQLETLLNGKCYKQTINCDSTTQGHWLLDAQPWIKNCLGLGPAIHARPNLIVDSLHLLITALYRLYELWPTQPKMKAFAHHYNQATLEERERIDDSDSLHLWSACHFQTKLLTQAAQHRKNIFCSEGRVPPYEGETLSEEQWVALLMGLHVTPQITDPFIENQPTSSIVSDLNRLKELLHHAALKAPTLEEFYRKEILQ